MLALHRRTVHLPEVLAGLSYALDLTEGQRPGHSVRSCLIGMRIAEAMGLPLEQRSSLYYALLMKDLGCSSNAARFAALFASDDHQLKSDLKTVDWSRALESFRYVANSVAPGQSWLTRVWKVLGVLSRGPEGAKEVVRTRCDRGADIARMLRFSSDTVHAIRTIDEHWDGKGQPYELKGDDIPLLGRIVGLAQTFEVFYSSYGILTAFDMSVARRGRWFDPALVEVLLSIRKDGPFWQSLVEADQDSVAVLEPPEGAIAADDEYLDVIAEAFAKVIDAKSPWTYSHSTGVADLSMSIGRLLGFAPHDLTELRRAALLHDLGKLGVSNLILDKPDKLTKEELQVMRQHPAQTRQILSRVGCFKHLADLAASHHERLDGKGYHRGIAREGLSLAARVICAADICDALRAPRPYREGLPTEKVLEIMSPLVGKGIDPACFEAMKQTIEHESAPREEGAPAVQIVRSLENDYQQAA